MTVCPEQTLRCVALNVQTRGGWDMCIVTKFVIS